MTFCNPLTLLSSASILFLASIVEVRGFVAHAPQQGCGVTSTRQQANACRIVSMSAHESDGGMSRREWAGRAVGGALAAVVAATQGSGNALADLGVGEGGLPDGARQFSNFVKVQKDWVALGKTIRSKGADVAPEEWKNVALFLRKVYQLGGDLEFLAGTFPADKKKQAIALVRDIQKEVQAADTPARERNAEAFLAAQSSVEGKFETFMEFFNDVPSEL